MLWLKFGGWFQCRLPTDPDPTDEPRGVSGYVVALAGEPDLDRIIRLQSPVVERRYCPTIGVSVQGVFQEAGASARHPLLGATVELLDNPKFEGRNGIIAEAGFEPVVPFHLRISKGAFSLQRRHQDKEVPPYVELRGSGINASPAAIAEATGIWDLGQHWTDRRAKLTSDIAASGDPTFVAAARRRLQTLGNLRLSGFFGARMQYSFPLAGASAISDPENYLSSPIDADNPWPVEFWFGGWDPDCLSGYMQGYLGLPFKQAQQPATEAVRLMRTPSGERRA
jgi:hypothetical protein